MIDLLSAGLEDTSVVELPAGSIDADAQGSAAGEVVHHGVDVVALGDVLPGADVVHDVAGAELALSVLGSVRVAGLGVLASGRLNVLVGDVGPASVAAVGLGAAIDNLLLREVVDLGGDSLDVVHALNLLGGAEGPAGSALALVLDGADSGGGDSAGGVVPPVPVGGELGDGGDLAGVHDLVGLLDGQGPVGHQVHVAELGGGQVHELGHAKHVVATNGTVVLVHLGDTAEVGLEHTEPHGLLVQRGVVLAMLHLELLEGTAGLGVVGGSKG